MPLAAQAPDKKTTETDGNVTGSWTQQGTHRDQTTSKYSELSYESSYELS
jgi:hypothetical protein